MLDQAVNWLISLESWLATRAILGASHMNLGGGKRARRAVKSAKIARYRVISHIIAKYRGDDIVKGYGQGRDFLRSRCPPDMIKKAHHRWALIIGLIWSRGQ